MTDKCECTEPGFCVRYNKQMTANMVRTCQCPTDQCGKYRSLWLKQRPTLLGDVVHTIAKVTGIAAVAKVVEKITRKPCGCKGRRKNLNELHAKRKDQ